MLLTRPRSTRSSMAAQVSLKGGTTSGPAFSELGLHDRQHAKTICDT